MTSDRISPADRLMKPAYPPSTASTPNSLKTWLMTVAVAATSSSITAPLACPERNSSSKATRFPDASMMGWRPRNSSVEASTDIAG